MIKIGKRWYKEENLTYEDKIKLGLVKRPKEVKEKKPKEEKKEKKEGK